LAWFGAQLALNVGWTILFFGRRSPGEALIEILVLSLTIAATTVIFWGRSTAAGLLMTPYLVWTMFAGLLNFAIWRMNPGSIV
jgi:tryptophan-rich sensory protein